MIFRKLEYLIALARQRHFGRAAAACQISQPTLSAALRQLEVEIGAPIVKRGQRYNGLTEQGERVLAFAQKMTAVQEQLRRELEDRGGDSTGTLQVGAIPAAVPAVVTLAIVFNTQYPNSAVKLMELSPEEIQRAFEESRLHVAVTYLEDNPPRHARVQKLYSEDYSFVIRQNGNPALRKPISWDEASRCPLCLLAPEILAANSRVVDLLNQGNHDSPRLETNSMTALRAHIRAGPWAAILPSQLAKDMPGADELVAIALPRLRNPISVGIIMPSRETAIPLAEAFFRIAAFSKPVSSRVSSRPLRR